MWGLVESWERWGEDGVEKRRAVFYRRGVATMIMDMKV